MSFSESSAQELTAVIPICEPIEALANLRHLIYEIRDIPINLILVVDMENDDTFKYLQEVTKDNSNISLFHVNFGNPGQTREFGRQFVTSEFVCFWDSDDKPKISAILQTIEEDINEIDVFIGNYSVCYLNEEREEEIVEHQGNLNVIHINPGIWRFIFRKKSLSEAHFPALSMGEDQVFLLEMKLWEKNVAFVNKVFYQYSVGRVGQLTQSKPAISDILPAFSLITTNINRHASISERRYYAITATRLYVSLVKRLPFLLLIKPSIFMILHPSIPFIGVKTFLIYQRKQR